MKRNQKEDLIRDLLCPNPCESSPRPVILRLVLAPSSACMRGIPSHLTFFLAVERLHSAPDFFHSLASCLADFERSC